MSNNQKNKAKNLRNIEEIKHYYSTSFDIYQYFRTKESVGKFIEFLLEESLKFNKKIKENGDKVPLPLVYGMDSIDAIIDYNFMIYTLARWVGILTNDKAKVALVIIDFGITKYSTSDDFKDFKDRDRLALSFFFSEILKIFVNRNKAKEENKRYDKGGCKISQFPVFIEKLVSIDDEYFSYKVLKFNKTQIKYYYENYYKFVDKNMVNLMQTSCLQEAYSYKNCRIMWEELAAKGIEKRIAFSIDDKDLLGDLDILLERNAKLL